ncbi:MAG: hypothetical protein WBW88_05645 [Rhodothermales bacterium]
MLIRTLAVVLVLALAACDADHKAEDKADETGGAVPHETVQSAPGEAVSLSGRVEGDVEWHAGKGRVVDRESETLYIPPPDNGSYTVDAKVAGKPVFALSVQVAGLKPQAVTGLTLDPQGGVNLAYGDVAVSARRTPDGHGEAVYSLGDQKVTALVTGYDEGTVSWDGVTLGGKGALSVQQMDALREMGGSKLAAALTMTSLELACRPGAEGVDPAAAAALLLPWQLMLKYLTSYPMAVARQYAALTSCAYFPDVTAPRDTSAAARAPEPNVMVLNNESPLPATLLYFPLDGEGAVRAPSAAMSQ